MIKKRSWTKLAPLLAVLVVMAMLLSGCYGRSQPRGWAGATVADGGVYFPSIVGRVVAVDSVEGGRLWPVDAQLGGEDDRVAVYGSLAVADGLVYVGGYNGKLYALSTDTGSLRWVYPREDKLDPIVGGVVASGGRVYFVTSDAELYILDGLTGDRLGQANVTEDKVWSTPVLDGDTLYVGSLDKHLYALDADDGGEKWRYQAGGAVASVPIVYEDAVYFGSFDVEVYAVNKADGALKWRSDTGATNWFWARPVIHNGVVFAPNMDGKVYILDASSGTEVREAVDVGSPVASSPVLWGDSLVLASKEGRVYTLDTAGLQLNTLFEVRSENEEIVAPLTVADGVIYIHAQSTKHDILYAIKAVDGTEAWRSVSLSMD